MKKIEVYSDGSATTEDKPGGYGWVIVIDGTKHSEGSGYLQNASNNDAEMEGAIIGLANAYKVILDNLPVPRPEVWLVSDSKIILSWADGSWRFKQNKKLHKYEQLQRLVKSMSVQTRHVYGHTGDEHNERCDKLANAARKGMEVAEKKPKSKIGKKTTDVISIWYKNCLKVVDLANNVCENYNPELHGERQSSLEVEDKDG